MKIIEFAFSGDRFNEHLPHCYDPNSVVYGGTHDNETLAGYFKPENVSGGNFSTLPITSVQRHQSEVVDRVFRAAYGSVASVAIFQMQDVLKLDNWARMNTPGTLGENWRWRLVPGQFTDERADYLSWLVDTFGRF
ncbi:MAG: 4-alpha-glucanotransferase [Clostridium fessum]